MGLTKQIAEDRLRNTRAWAAARPDMSGSGVIVGAIDELLQLREVLIGAGISVEWDDTGKLTWRRASAEPTVSQELRDARRLVGMLIAEAGGHVVLRKQTMAAFDPAATVEFSEDQRTGDRILKLIAPERTT